MMPLTVKSYKFLLILFWVYLSLSNSSAWCQATRTFDDTLKILNQTQLNPQHQIFSKLANQGDPVAKAKEISLRVQRLLKDQQFSGATKLLDQGLEECAATGQSAKKCQAILYFNYGYLYEQWAAQNRSQKGALLNKSVANYRNVLQIFPDQPQAIYNLVLVLQQLQRDQEAVELLTGAIENDPDRAYTYHLMLGKIFYKNDAIPKALTSFRNAAKLEPFKETAHRHILRCYPKMTVDSLENLLGYSLQLKDYQLPQLAMEGLEQ
ncbi:tetratricopeptide repeat protein, partial [Candidatus Saccharibacteria bacterium]|nr:tetratricopeptide repeat protein [Candidatus Saccharibacteria bacterium]NIW00093.1 tetratricopeptide repeat protein [Candidatus Saccharibacteria bacterium]NIW80433.1 tetratricopeptide repeat protein [Calditrichia bacterium]